MFLLGCALYDNAKKQHVAFTFCNTKAEYLRSTVEAAIMQYKNLNDLTPVILCTYDPETGDIVPEYTKFKFDEYKMPASKADALAPLGVDFSKEALEYAQWKKERTEKDAKEK